MDNKKLLVFIGKIGAGKSTLINEAFADASVIDVQPFVTAYTVDGKVPEEKTIDGYRDMYKSLTEKEDKEIILELGTNHAEFNVQQLKKLNQDWTVHIFICIASIESLRERIAARGGTMDRDAIERRLNVDFPSTHLTMIEEAGIPYTILDMEQPWTDNVILARQRVRDL